MAIAPGQKIGDYEVIAKLGAGGLGIVYEVQHLIAKRREAMKLLQPAQLGAPEMVERFHREVQTLAALNHVNIAALHTAFYYEDQLAMVMEMVHGETLRERRRKGSFTLAQVLDFASQTLQALIYAHGLGVVHRDIKPSNIMITDTGIVKLLDFGIARTERSTELTRAGYLMGSLNYMSPEQVRGDKATARSDLYSVGVTIYELLTSRLPITGNSNYEVMIGHMQQIPVPPHEIVAQIPADLSAAVMRSLEKDPDKRFASAEEFLRALPIASTLRVHEALTQAMPSPTGPATGSRVSTGSLSPKPQSGSGMPTLPLEEVSRKLAVYIGPVAKFVVKKLAAQSEDMDWIYREASKEIKSGEDRANFLRSRNR